jgi:hypothetical protein
VSASFASILKAIKYLCLWEFDKFCKVWYLQSSKFLKFLANMGQTFYLENLSNGYYSWGSLPSASFASASFAFI